MSCDSAVIFIDNFGFRCQNPPYKPTKSSGKRWVSAIPAIIQESRIEMRKPASLVIVYICLATGCAILGVVITFLVLFLCQYFGVDILHENLWVLAIPVTLSLLLNVLFIELYRRYKKK